MKQTGHTVLAAAGMLATVLSLTGCSSILPKEHNDPRMVTGYHLTVRRSTRLKFNYVVKMKNGVEPAGLALWFGDKEHIVVALGSDHGTVDVEYTPEGLYWVTVSQPEGVMMSERRTQFGPIALADFAFRKGDLVLQEDGRIAIGDGVRPGGPKVTVYLGFSGFLSDE
jgi:hypothetical protein